MTAPSVGTINVELLAKVLDHIRKHPEQHDQGDWGQAVLDREGTVQNCGTTACLAGWAVLLTGQFNWIKYPAPVGGQQWAELAAVDENGERVKVSWRAQELLGLDDDQADELFLQLDHLDELYEAANRMTNGAIEIPEELAR